MMSSQILNSFNNNFSNLSFEKIQEELTLFSALEDRTNFLKQQITHLNKQLKKNFNDPVQTKQDKLNSIVEYLELSCLKNYLTVELSLNSKQDD